MSNTIRESNASRKSSLIVEIIGPAGAGKTTLANIISQRANQVEIGVNLNRLVYAPFFISNILPFLPTFLSQYHHTHWFNSEETRSIVYLAAWHYVLVKQKPLGGKISILDHGPIYRLAMLREFGPNIIASQLFEHWWNAMFVKWATLLDAIIWVDAPNDILKERIHTRNRWHKVKNKSDQVIYYFLERYRNSYEQVIKSATESGNLQVLRIDTHHETPEQVGDEALTFLAQSL